MQMQQGSPDSLKAELAMSVGASLGSTLALYMKAHGFHWNVKGQDFVEFHQLFSSIYEDAIGAIDPMAELILMLGYDAPASLSHMLSLSVIEEGDNESTDDPVGMSAHLLEAIQVVNAQILETFALASEANEQGIANFMADRDASHKKWAWQLRSITGAQTGGQLPAGNQQAAFYAAGSRSGARTVSPNPKGSAATGRAIKFSPTTETALMEKVKEHNKDAKPGHKATLTQLKAVYRRGAGAYSSSHRPGTTRNEWAMARVNAYLRLLKSGKPANPNYKQDNDLLPEKHPKSTASDASGSVLTAAAKAATELIVELGESHEYSTPEHALTAFAEYSGLGYDIIPALRASWKRGVDNNESGFDRARELAIMTHDSQDSDLLPKFES